MDQNERDLKEIAILQRRISIRNNTFFIENKFYEVGEYVPMTFIRYLVKFKEYLPADKISFIVYAKLQYYQVIDKGFDNCVARCYVKTDKLILNISKDEAITTAFEVNGNPEILEKLPSRDTIIKKKKWWQL